MTKVKDLNPTRVGRLGGTDLGIPFAAFGDVGFEFGDSFDGDRPAVASGPDWRSPVILWSKSHDVSKPIEFSSAVKGGAQLWPYQHNNPEYSTILPCDCIEIDGRLYTWVMVTKGLADPRVPGSGEKWCEIRYSDDRGATWVNTGVRWSTSAFGGKRTMISWARQPGTDIVYVISTGGLLRNKGMLLWRTTIKDIANPRRWEGWCFAGGQWKWIMDPPDNAPSEILPGWKFGEICLRFIEDRPVISGFDAGDYSIFVMVGSDIYQDWTKAKVYRPVTGMPRRGADTLPQLYGGYVHPDSRFDGLFCVIVSQWVTSGNPYRAVQFVFGGVVKPPLPASTTPAQPAPEPSKETPMADANTIAPVVGAGETTTSYDANNPNAQKPGLNLWGAVKRILFENTLWTQLLVEKDVRARHAKQETAETTHGHSRDASSATRVIIAQNDKILRNQAKLGAKLGVTDLEA